MTYLGKIESHLPAVEVTFVEFCSCLCSGQSIGKVYPHPTETLEELEGDVLVKGTEEILKTSLWIRGKHLKLIHLTMYFAGDYKNKHSLWSNLRSSV